MPGLRSAAPDPLGAARPSRRACAVGEILRDRAGAAARPVPAARPRCAQGAGHARPLDRARHRPRGDGAASPLAGAQRFPALRLCQRPRRADARPARSPFASGGVRRRPAGVPAAGAADRRAAVLAAANAGWTAAIGRRRCFRPPDRDAAGVRPGRDHVALSRSAADAAPSPCGAIRSGCSSACGSCSTRSALSLPAARAGSAALWAAVFAVFALAFVVNYAVLPRFDQSLPRRVLSRRSAGGRARSAASGPPPAGRSPT